MKLLRSHMVQEFRLGGINGERLVSFYSTNCFVYLEFLKIV